MEAHSPLAIVEDAGTSVNVARPGAGTSQGVTL
ncbi:MAG: hypothetical protein KatS3mg058_0109 [Roseiflexus sp.]|nr:MAG: hypothetical protein KatS3mg058_0109 [Roseiflexus sp.]